MNEQQQLAATAPNGYVQIIAGPGTGKTYTLVQRIIELLKRGINPSGIVVVTFTRAAAHEILERVNKATGVTTKLTIGTFHSVALRLLRKYGGELHRRVSVIDEHDKADILRRMSCVNGSDARRIAKEISKIKMTGGKIAIDPAVSEVYKQYEHQLTALNKVDFDGLLLRFRDFLKTSEITEKVVDAVLVDEFQDTSILQLEIAMLLAKRCANMTIVGDPDQSIYAFRNADPRNFMEMAKQVATQKLYLEKNYRSEQSILSAATRVIKDSKNRYASDRTLVAAKGMAGTQVQFVRSMSLQEEARIIATSIRSLIDSGIHHKEICALSRYSSKLQSIEAALLASGIPSRVVGGRRLAEQREVRLIIDYLRVVLNDNDSLAIERTVNNPKRGFGEKALSCARDKNGFLTLRSIRALATEQSRRYTSMIDSIRKFIIPATSDCDIATAVKQANALIDQVASMLFDFDPTVSTSEIGPHVEAIKGAITQFQELAVDMDDEDDRSFLEAFIDHWSLGTDTAPAASDSERDEGQVTLSTIHSAKGLEWPIVYMIDASEDDYIGPVKRDIEEERRLLYVAMTRAKSVLVVSSANKAGFNSLLHVPKTAVQTEISAPEMKSLSACVGRELRCIPKDHQKRSMLSKSKRFNAKAPVELPPGFQLASDLPQEPQKRLERPLASRKSSVESSKKLESERISKKGPKKSQQTLMNFFASRPKANS